MKTCILLAILFGTMSVQAQTLKDLLYSGKLKMDSGAMIRKTDDLRSKTDTSTRKPVESKQIKVNMDSPVKQDSVQKDAAVISAGATKDNNKIWKDYIDTLTGTLRTEVLPSKKIKSGTYLVLIEYAIGTDGQVTVNTVSSSPENSFLEQQIKERITLGAPQMTPLLGNNGKPRTAIKKQTLTLSK